MFRNVKRKRYDTTDMPVKKRKLSVARRRRRRFYRRRGRGRIPKLYRPVLPQVLVKLKYMAQFQYNLSAATPVPYFYRTSLYDPDFTAAGHQPLWHDQYALLYKKYKIYGMKYHISLASATPNNHVNFCVSHVPDSFNTAPGSWSLNTEWERRLCKHRGQICHATGRLSNFVAKGYLNVPKTECISKTEFAGHEDYEALFGANPTKQSKLMILMQSGGADTVNGIVRLTFYTKCYDPVDVNGS
jgi:hypothetical protein